MAEDLADLPGLARFSLRDRIALVTGAGRGLGFAIARAYAQCGARVILNGRDPQRLAHAAAAMGPARIPVETLPFDVTDARATEAAFASIRSRHGRLDILVNNVGVRNRKSFADFDAVEMRALLETDLISAMQLAQHAIALMGERRTGRLIAVTSIAGLLGRGGDAVYTAAKHGLTGLVRALAAEYGPLGITSNAIAPGAFATEQNAVAYADPEVRRHFDSRTPLGRWGEPDEIAGAAVFLASEAASYVNGHVVVVDGGMTASM